MKSFYQSKKWWASTVIVIASVASAAAGVDGITPSLAMVLSGIAVVAYQIAQGLSDFGKEAKAIEAASAERIVRPELSQDDEVSK